MTATKAERKYLAAHAEPEAQLAPQLHTEQLGQALIIPAHAEKDDLLAAIESVPPSPRGPVLVIVVVNARAGLPGSVHATNAATCSELRRRYAPSRELAPGTWQLEAARGPLLLIDRASRGRFLPPRQGVGLARKIGTDVALQLSSTGRISSPWIHTTDADVLLPEDYFERSEEVEAPDTTLLVYPFRHVAAGRHRQRACDSALEYEISLRYYVLGLRRARSPYAFHTIGSTLAVRGTAYAQVRGFPRRLAGEDFYLANKLRKLGRVTALRGDSVLLSDRASQRTPFGTGAAVRRARVEAASGRPFRCYHPLVFDQLGAWLGALDALCVDRSCDLEGEVEHRIAATAGASANAKTLLSALRESGQIARAKRRAERTADPDRLRRQLREGFDALGSLKLIHSLRESAYPSLALREAIAQARFVACSGDEELETIRNELEAAELL